MKNCFNWRQKKYKNLLELALVSEDIRAFLRNLPTHPFVHLLLPNSNQVLLIRSLHSLQFLCPSALVAIAHPLSVCVPPRQLLFLASRFVPLQSIPTTALHLYRVLIQSGHYSACNSRMRPWDMQEKGNSCF